MGRENKYGLTEACMKDTGRIIKHVDKDNKSTLTVIFILAYGMMTKLMGKEDIFILTEPNTMDNGSKINNKVTESKNGSMVQNIQENTLTARKTEKVSSHGLMEVATRVHLSAIIYKVSANTYGETVNHTRDNGKTTK